MLRRGCAVLKRVIVVTAAVMSMGATGVRAVQVAAPGNVSIEQRMDALENRVDRLTDQAAAGAGVLFVIGCICALWAQNTRRNAWLWFFLGLLFNLLTLVIMLWKNANDTEMRSQFRT